MKTETPLPEDLAMPLEPTPSVDHTEAPTIPEPLPLAQSKPLDQTDPEEPAFSCRESIHIEQLEQNLQNNALETNELPSGEPGLDGDVKDSKSAEDENENADEDKGVRSKVYVCLEYFLGFVLGLSFNLFSYMILSYMSKKERKRKGIFVGCMISFALIFLICLSFMSYTRQSLLAERNWSRKHSSFHGLHIPSFWQYLTGQVGSHYKLHKRASKKRAIKYNRAGVLLTKPKPKKKTTARKMRQSVPTQLSRAERRRRERERIIESLNRTARKFRHHMKYLL